ncbi:hypothetical protein Aperf_G00000018738 [Anoplocephala perfoliata]
MLSRPFSSYHRKFLLYLGLCLIFFVILLHLTRKSYYIPSTSFYSRENKIVVFNRIPKTGSTSVVRIFESLSDRNNFHVYRLAIFNPLQFLSPLGHKAFINEISSISRYTNLLVHGHFYYLNFDRFGIGDNHVYINILRDPLDRLVSKYYFIRFGDDHRPNTRRRRMTNDTLQHQTFDECVETHGEDCNPKLLWTQIPFFCGTAAYCHIPGNHEALESAKRRLVEDYLLVGVLDYFNEFMELLSNLLPNYLNGIEETKNLQIDGHPMWHLRSTRMKAPVKRKTRQFFQNNTIWRMEQSFYEFAKSEFTSRFQFYRSSLPFDANRWRQSTFIRAL